MPGSNWLRQAFANAHSNPVRVISMLRTRSWPGLVAHPERYIIQRNEGLIQVMRSRLKGGTSMPARSAPSAIDAGNAWYTTSVSSVNTARTSRRGVSIVDTQAKVAAQLDHRSRDPLSARHRGMFITQGWLGPGFRVPPQWCGGGGAWKHRQVDAIVGKARRPK